MLCVGMSHRSAGIDLLSRVAVPGAGLGPVLDDLIRLPHLDAAVVLSTCNRFEVIAEVTGFHGGLADIAGVLATRARMPLAGLASHLYVHFEAAAVQHVFQVAAGLDSLVIGEAQILGQLRDAYTAAASHGSVGTLLHALLQHALRVGKRIHSETDLDSASRSVVTAALDRGAAALGSHSGRSALVIGAGSMGALTLAALRRAGAGTLYVANRSMDRAIRLATAHGAVPVAIDDLAPVLGEVDTVVTVTAAVEPVLGARELREARPDRAPVLVCDLAVPRNVRRDVADLPWVTLVDLESLAERGEGGDPSLEAEAAAGEARAIVDAEVEAFTTWQRGLRVAPTVAALRARADQVVETELGRLVQRRPDFDQRQRDEIAATVHRIVRRLLHQPSVRIRELAAEPGGEQYARTLRDLFDLQVPQPDGIREGVL